MLSNYERVLTALARTKGHDKRDHLLVSKVEFKVSDFQRNKKNYLIQFSQIGSVFSKKCQS